MVVVSFPSRVFRLGTLLSLPVLLTMNLLPRRDPWTTEQGVMGSVSCFLDGLFASAAGLLSGLLLTRHMTMLCYWSLSVILGLEGVHFIVVRSQAKPSGRPIPLRRTLGFLGTIVSVAALYPLAASLLTRT